MLKLRYISLLLVCLSALLSLTLPGCKLREERLQTTGALEFSVDTVKFDTVFTTLRTVTKRLWVYNRNPRAVSVSLINLDNPATSPYTLIINGDLKQTAADLTIRGQDSLLILVRAKLPDNQQNGPAKAYVLEEKLNFLTNGQPQRVLLRSFGQNIYLHDGETLRCGTVWRNDRPHVLYNTVSVPATCTLRLLPGTRVFAHAGAVLVVDGTLLVNAPADYQPGAGPTDTVKASNPSIVRFAGDRSGEAQYATAPGQWAGIVLRASSRSNVIRYALIQNAAVGVLLYNPLNQQPRPDLLLQNSVIRYISGSSVSFAGVASSLGLPGAAVLGVASRASLENVLLSDCYEYAVLGIGGGDYALNFCTVANFPASTTPRASASLTFNNTITLNGQAVAYPLKVDVRNSIVWGSLADELSFEKYDQYKNGVTVENSLLRTALYAAATDAPGKPGLGNQTLFNVLNVDPKFTRTNSGNRDDYRPGTGSLALGRQARGSFLPRDLLNLPRNPGAPDLGAYKGK